ncbi:MAG TPA: hypothetical protein VG097_09725 [Gemmata sp.]|jgi:hypothetical protein|nr:hypothetical protein [Gemmata sp.]
MDQGALVKEEIDAGAELIRQFEQYAPVKAAFWMKASEKPFRYLYIASDEITDKNFDLAYSEIIRIVKEMNDPNFGLFRVKVIGSNHPIARDVLDIYRRHPNSGAINYRGRFLGDVAVDDAYIYPQTLVHS